MQPDTLVRKQLELARLTQSAGDINPKQQFMLWAKTTRRIGLLKQQVALMEAGVWRVLLVRTVCTAHTASFGRGFTHPHPVCDQIFLPLQLPKHFASVFPTRYTVDQQRPWRVLTLALFCFVLCAWSTGLDAGSPGLPLV